MARISWTFLAMCAAFLPNAALADPIPEPVVRIITEAAKSGNPATLQTAIDLAKATNPRSIAEIDALAASLKAEADAAHTAKLNSQGFFEGWTGEGEAGGSLTTGTTKNKTLALGANLTKDGIDWRHKIIAAANYQRSDGVTTANRYLASYEGDYKFSPMLFAYGFFQWEQDKFAGFNRRFTESLGLGYTILATPEFNWQISGGPALRQTDLITNQSKNDMSARANTVFLWNISPATVFSEELGTFIGGSDSTYFSTTSLTTKVAGDLSARVSFNITNESNPPPGIDNTNTITRFTLVYSF